MKCADVRLAMLEVDAVELTGSGAGPVAEHIAECAECRARAAVILAGTQVLRRAVVERFERVVTRPSRARFAIGASAIAAAVVAVAVLNIHASGPGAGRHVRQELPGGVTIQDSQGHEVTVIQSPDTAFTAIVFWNGESK